MISASAYMNIIFKYYPNYNFDVRKLPNNNRNVMMHIFKSLTEFKLLETLAWKGLFVVLKYFH